MKKYTFPFFPFTSKKLLKLFTISRRLGLLRFFSFLSAIYGSNPSEVGDLKPHLCFFFLVIRSGVPSSYYWLCFCLDAQRQNCLASAASLERRRTYYYLPFFFLVLRCKRLRGAVPTSTRPGSTAMCGYDTLVFFFCHTLVYARALRIIQKNNCEQRSYVRGERRRKERGTFHALPLSFSKLFFSPFFQVVFFSTLFLFFFESRLYIIIKAAFRTLHVVFSFNSALD